MPEIAEFEAGVLHGIVKIGAVLQQNFPQHGASKNAVANKPLLM